MTRKWTLNGHIFFFVSSWWSYDHYDHMIMMFIPSWCSYHHDDHIIMIIWSWWWYEEHNIIRHPSRAHFGFILGSSKVHLGFILWLFKGFPEHFEASWLGLTTILGENQFSEKSPISKYRYFRSLITILMVPEPENIEKSFFCLNRNFSDFPISGSADWRQPFQFQFLMNF